MFGVALALAPVSVSTAQDLAADHGAIGGKALCAGTGTGAGQCTRKGTRERDVDVSTARSTGSYGAIAVSTLFLNWGAAWDRETLDEARDDAFDLCDSPTCEGAAEVKDRCSALATGYDGWGAAWDHKASVADVLALEACSEYTTECTLAVSFCSGEAQEP